MIGNNYKSLLEKLLINKERRISNDNKLEVNSNNIEANNHNDDEAKSNKSSSSISKSVMTVIELPTMNKVTNRNSNFVNPNVRNSTTYQDNARILDKYDINKALFKADIYSLGLIIWEIFSEIQPFNVSLKDVYKFVVEENLRPEIVIEKIPPSVSGIIKKCWNKDINSRISLDDLIEELNRISF